MIDCTEPRRQQPDNGMAGEGRESMPGGTA
jgi:hypothetical protein